MARIHSGSLSQTVLSKRHSGLPLTLASDWNDIIGRFNRRGEGETVFAGQQLIPANAMASVGLERYRAEPYAWVSNIIGPENPHFGWANVEQITGTAPWMDVASTQYLLGIRATLEGLLIDPCIPADWPQYTVRRRYRGCDLTITVKNPGKAGKGVASLQLDGEALPVANGALIPADKLKGKQQARIESLLDRLGTG